MKSFVKKNYQILSILFLVLTLILFAFLYNAALEPDKNPPDTNNNYLLGDYYFNYGTYADGTYDLTLARKHYEMALEENPIGDNWAWYQLGRIDFLEGRFNDALYKFDKQIEFFGNTQPSVYYMIALTHGYKARMWGASESWEPAAENFLHYLELDPSSPWARTDLAWIYFAQGSYDEMLEPLRVGLEINPDNPWLLNMYGLALLNTNDKEGAQEYFLKAKEKASDLTTEEWGRSYPGNDPKAWSKGLKEFQETIEFNLQLTS